MINDSPTECTSYTLHTTGLITAKSLSQHMLHFQFRENN